MSDFMKFVFGEFRNSLSLVLLTTVLAAAALLFSRFVYRKRYGTERKLALGKAVILLIFIGYCAVVAYATVLRFYGGYRQVNLHLFRAWREAWNNFSVQNWANVLLNIAMFVPLGFLLPFLAKVFRKWYVTIPVGVMVPLGIELIQLASIRGICDVDDWFCNGLGCVIGYGSAMFLLALVGQRGRRFKPALIYGILVVTLLGAIGSIFVVYHAREYGNLPGAASYTLDTGNVTWSMHCEFPHMEDTCAVYQTQRRSRADCDAFAEDFKKIISTEYNTVSYYQDAAYYMDNGSEGGAHFLYVNYLDQGYAYSAVYDDTPLWGGADRDSVIQLLEKYPLQIPDSAEFTVLSDGWYSFGAERQTDGNTLIDGILRVRIAGDGSVWKLENSLLSHTFYDTAEIISPEQAYTLLCAGEFQDHDFFEMKNPGRITVQSCKLEYRIDTKGFYQPVYVFELVSADGDYQDRAVIPAIQ